jgi:uncharacterized protein (TIGR03435 family)
MPITTEDVALKLNINRRLLLLAVIALLGGVETLSRAQSPVVASPSFAVATIKPNKSGNPGGGSMFFPGGSFEARNLTVKELIRVAYGIPFNSLDQVSGGPAWIRSARFDVDAKAEQPLPADVEKIPDHYKMMVQALLAERFKLKVHHETKELPVYVLAIANGGPKLAASTIQPTTADNSEPHFAFGAKLPTPQSGSWRGTRMQGRGQAKAMRETTGMFVNFLQDQPELGGRLVIDKTELKGEYDFTLRWTPEGEPMHLRDSGLPPADASWPSLFTSIQEELGLKLQSTKGPTDTIVIDSVEMPSVN